MTDPKPQPLQLIERLNRTPEAMHAWALLQGTEQSSESQLHLVSLLEWALLNLAADPVWVEAVLQAAGLAEARDPAALQANLAQAPGLLQTRTRTEAGKALLSLVADLVPPDKQPA